MVNSNNASNAWHFCYSYFSDCAIKIQDYNVEDFEKFLEYFKSYISISSEISLYITLRKISRSYLRVLFLSRPAINKITNGALGLKNTLEMKSEQYEKEKQNFENIGIIQPLLVYGNALTRFNNGIRIAPDPVKLLKSKSELKKRTK